MPKVGIAPHLAQLPYVAHKPRRLGLLGFEQRQEPNGGAGFPPPGGANHQTILLATVGRSSLPS